MHLAIPQPVSTLYVDVARRRSELSRLQVGADFQPLGHGVSALLVARKRMRSFGKSRAIGVLQPCGWQAKGILRSIGSLRAALTRSLL